MYTEALNWCTQVNPFWCLIKLNSETRHTVVVVFIFNKH